jgi:hypothetical protein
LLAPLRARKFRALLRQRKLKSELCFFPRQPRFVGTHRYVVLHVAPILRRA